MTTEYQINYHTHNEYEGTVTEAMFEFLVAPCNNNSQTVTQLSFYNSLGAEIFQVQNPFGFTLARMRHVKPFLDLQFWMKATVEKSAPNYRRNTQLPYEEENRILHSQELLIDHHLFLQSTHYTYISEEFGDSLLVRKEGQPVWDYLMELNQNIYGRLEFDPNPTNVHTTANEVVALGKGVCQDYTHLFLAAARNNRIPCRYVSGYLNQGGSLVGAAVMHAWAEAYIPGLGWRGFDPTNNLIADINYIKAAHGVDYGDCSPIKGVLKTTGKNNHTSYEVKVIPTLQEEAAQ